MFKIFHTATLGSALLVALDLSELVSGMPVLKTRAIFQPDGPQLFTRASSTCWKLINGNVQTIPGWGKINQYREEHWGHGGGDLWLNHEKYPDYTALACLGNTQITSHWTSEPQCTEEIVDLGGKTGSGVNLTVDVSKEAARESRVGWTVMKSSELTIGSEITVGIGSDDVGAKAEAKFSVSSTFKDETTNSTESVTTSKDTIGFSYEHGANQECSAKIKVTTCTGKASAHIPVIATGYLWFFFHDSIPDKTNAASGNHYHWNIHMDSVLSEAERTRTIELAGTVKTTTRADYTADCVAAKIAARKATGKAGENGSTKDGKDDTPAASKGKEKPSKASKNGDITLKDTPKVAGRPRSAPKGKKGRSSNPKAGVRPSSPKKGGRPAAKPKARKNPTPAPKGGRV